MPIPVTADLGVELTVSLSATYIPARRASTPRGEYAPIDPDDPESLEDITISGLLYDTYELDYSTPLHTRRVVTHNLLENVDTSCREVQKLLENLLGCVQSAATEALFAEAGE